MASIRECEGLELFICFAQFIYVGLYVDFQYHMLQTE